MMDKDGALSPLAYLPPAYIVGPMEAERLERQRLAAETQALSGTVAKAVSEIPGPIVRGFGEDYRDFPEEMQTDIDVEKLIYYIKGTGSEVRSSTCSIDNCVMDSGCIQNVFTSCYSSLDAGHYLSDYLYYCSLAEAKRTTTKKGKSSKVLLVQCPPANLPLSSGEVAEALRRIVIWICGTIE
jgi:pyroglutamyl-peptidase